MDHTAKFYSSPSYVGSGVVFSGARRQRGGSVLGALKSLVMPIARVVGPRILKSAGDIAKRQLIGLATDVLWDKVRGRDLKESLKTRGKARLIQTAAHGLHGLRGTLRARKAKRDAARAAKRKRRTYRGRGAGAKKRKTVTK